MQPCYPIRLKTHVPPKRGRRHSPNMHSVVDARDREQGRRSILCRNAHILSTAIGEEKTYMSVPDIRLVGTRPAYIEMRAILRDRAG